jgi:hypothetical protein
MIASDPQAVVVPTRDVDVVQVARRPSTVVIDRPSPGIREVGMTARGAAGGMPALTPEDDEDGPDGVESPGVDVRFDPALVGAVPCCSSPVADGADDPGPDEPGPDGAGVPGPAGSEEDGGGSFAGAAEISRVTVTVADCDPREPVMVRDVVPAAEGVPEMTPVELSKDRPAGRVPEVTV